MIYLLLEFDVKLQLLAVRIVLIRLVSHILASLNLASL
jgi:hypothetical protein